MKNSNELFIKTVRFNREKVADFNIYPFNIDIIKNFSELRLTSPVTSLVGENGTGKSTFIEALAVAYGLNPEGGTQNFNFSTKSTHSNLHEYIQLGKFDLPRTKYFLRAESFYNVATEIDNLELLGYGTNSLHDCSHGESFIQLIHNRFSSNGVYILDEPEAALSPTRQLTLLAIIDDLVKQGSQFIIATHSPILIAYKHGIIYDLNNNFEITEYEDTEIYKTYKMFLERYKEMQEQLFNDY